MSDKLRVVTKGHLAITDPSGNSIAIKLKKAAALFAILVFTPDHQCSRVRLYELLWEKFQAKQRQDSLRRAVYELRHALGAFRDVITSDGKSIHLDISRIECDVDPAAPAPSPADLAGARQILLDGVDIPTENGFTQWLAELREEFDRHWTAAREVSPAPAPAGTPAPIGVTGGLPSHRPGGVRPWIRINQPVIPSGDSGAFLAFIVAEGVAQTIAEFGGAEIREDPLPTPGMEIQVEAMHSARETSIQLSFRCAHSSVKLWSSSATLSNDDGFIHDSFALKRLIIQAANLGNLQLRKLSAANGSAWAFTAGVDAVQKMCSLDQNELDQAHGLLRQAYQEEGRGIFLAWDAYALTYDFAEYDPRNRARYRDQAFAQVRRAMELEPDNSMVFAIASYIHILFDKNYEHAHDLADFGLSINRFNALAKSFLSRAEAKRGKGAAAFDATDTARRLARFSPYYSTLDLMCGQAALDAGLFAEAQRVAENSMDRNPHYLAPQRYLLPMYLKQREVDGAARVYRNLLNRDPNFNIWDLAEPDYPINQSLLEAGYMDFDRELIAELAEKHAIDVLPNGAAR